MLGIFSALSTPPRESKWQLLTLTKYKTALAERPPGHGKTKRCRRSSGDRAGMARYGEVFAPVGGGTWYPV